MTEELKQQTLDKIASDTTVGIIITEFIKDTTGLAMTEAERKTYNDIIAGGKYADGPSMIAAIKAFRDSRVATNDTLGKQAFSKSPASSVKYRRYNPVTSRSSKPKPKTKVGGGGNTSTTTTTNSSVNYKDLL